MKQTFKVYQKFLLNKSQKLIKIMILNQIVNINLFIDKIEYFHNVKDSMQ